MRWHTGSRWMISMQLATTSTALPCAQVLLVVPLHAWLEEIRVWIGTVIGHCRGSQGSVHVWCPTLAAPCLRVHTAGGSVSTPRQRPLAGCITCTSRSYYTITTCQTASHLGPAVWNMQGTHYRR